MRGAWAIAKREFTSFFVSPVAYAVMAVFWLAEGAFFLSILNYWAARGAVMDNRIEQLGEQGNVINVPAMVANNFIDITSLLLLFVVPIVAMGLLAGEKRRGTMELLLTSPVGNAGIMWGKYLGALAFLVVLLAPTFAYQGFLVAFGDNEPGVWISGYIGLLLLAASMLAVALFVSALTESQVVAGFVGYGVLLIFWFLDAPANLLPHIWGDLVRWMAMYEHFRDFEVGLVTLRDLNYFACVLVLFLYLTYLVLESIRWRGVQSE